MTRILAVLVSFALSLTLGGCIDFAPAYKQELLTFDEGLLGSWVAEVPSEKDGVKRVDRVPVRVEKREARVTAGRLGEFNGGPDREKAGSTPTPAYRMTVSWEDQGTPRTRAYDAVLLRVEGGLYLAYQIAADEPAVKEAFGDVLPVHKVLRLERSGDVVTVRDMKREVVWLPGLRPLGGEGGEVRLPEAEGRWLVADADRFSEVLRLAARTPEFWGEPASLKRE